MNDAPQYPVRIQQRLRLRRFAMAQWVYLAVILASFLAGWMGLICMDGRAWALMIGIAVTGNLIFLFLIVSGLNLRLADPSMTWLQIGFSGLWGAVPMYLLPQLRAPLLMFYIPAFSFGMLRLSRRQYLGLVLLVMAVYSTMLLLKYAQAPAAHDHKSEIFIFVTFGVVLTWFAFFGGFMSDLRKRLREQNAAIQRVNFEIQQEIEERRRAQIEKDRLISELQQALAKVKTLSGLLPICSACKKIRDDQGYWNHLESYISDHSDAEFSHSICPDCAWKLYGHLPNFKPESSEKK